MAEIVKTVQNTLDAIRGCLIGGAAGDALGYAVEFKDEPDIFSWYGPNGIQEYDLTRGRGTALISDDTQMSLFTANCIVYANTRSALRGIGGLPSAYIQRFYLDWFRTQTMSFDELQRLKGENKNGFVSWLTDVPELCHRRAPGSTCMNAIYDFSRGREVINDSKGCGGVMRVAPLGCVSWLDIDTLDAESAEIAKVTHKHSLGYIPAAALTHIIHRIIFSRQEHTLKEIIEEAIQAAAVRFADDPHIRYFTELCEKAVRLSENSAADLENIHKLGEGWVAEETLAVAIYCALRYSDDFSAGIIAAVNHDGDSDSTGAVAGNILGAWLGYEAIEDKWKTNLEIMDVILEAADDLCRGCPAAESGEPQDEDWLRKYVRGTWRKTE